MDLYIGTKIIKARPMSLGDYNKYKGWDMPKDEDPDRPGCLVGYPDADGNFSGDLEGGADHISWSPAEVFDASYHLTDGIPFGVAIEAMKRGRRVARKGWNGKGMFVVYMSPLYLPPYSTSDTARKVNDRTAKWIGEDTPLDSQGYFAMFTATKQWQPGWLASQADMLADDWVILE
jgi:hypothetical protein